MSRSVGIGTCSRSFWVAHVLVGEPVPTSPEHALVPPIWKFLQRLPQARLGTSNRKRHWKHTLARAPLLPNFVSGRVAMHYELRKPGTRAAQGCIGLRKTMRMASNRLTGIPTEPAVTLP